MAIGVSAKITGLDKLNRNIARLSKAMRDEALKDALEAAAEPVLEYAENKVPVDEGDLRDALEISEPEVRNAEGVIRVFVNSEDGVFYGHIVELGSSHQAAQPYLRPALSQTRPKQRNALIDSVNKTTNKVL